MKVKKADILFTYMRRKYTAQVSFFQPENTKPMVRIHVELNDKHKKEIVFIYYKVKSGELFWFDLPNHKDQAMAKQVADMIHGK